MDSHRWGVTREEAAKPFPCDGLLDRTDAGYYRAVSIAAPATVVFGWLCQLRVAPYSYDWIDNLGRRSPRTRTAGLTELRGGERFMVIFELCGFEPHRSITIRLRRDLGWLRVIGDSAITYRIEPVADGACRLVVKVAMLYPRGLRGRLMRWFLPTGDLIMMRKQLLTLKDLSEGEFARGAGAPG
jgi:hypothetical protein